MPIDFSLTEEQRQLQALARRFAKEVILPVAREYDEKEEVPWPVIEKLHEVGLLNAIIPEEYGGMGLKMLDAVIVGEELPEAPHREARPRRLRLKRARKRLGRRRPQDQGHSPGRPLRPERHQDVDL